MTALLALAARTRVTHCLDCGKCTPVCPVARFRPGFSPRKLIARVLDGNGDGMLMECLGCGACETRCPPTVSFVSFVQQARAVGDHGRTCPVAHGGLFDAPRQPQSDGLEWLGSKLRVQERGEILYYVGCAPMFDAFFGYLGVRTLDAARATIRSMNALGVEPAILGEAICCGHDQLWSGDVDTFRELAERNVALIAKTGAKTVVTACAECARCLGLDYPEALGKVPFETMHASRWLAERLPDGGNSLGPVNRHVTFQDPCRLARHLGETDAPRRLLAQIPGLEHTEMSYTGRDAVCCGTEGFSRCTAVSKAIQVSRLTDAAATGAQTLLTACPKCLVHLSCALADPDVDIDLDIRDVTEIVADALTGTTHKEPSP